METSASFEARYAPWFYPAGTGNRPGHPGEQETEQSQTRTETTAKAQSLATGETKATAPVLDSTLGYTQNAPIRYESVSDALD
jgi:hypothetical protein